MRNNSISSLFFVILIFCTFSAIVVFTLIDVLEEYRGYSRAKQEIEREYLSSKKADVKSLVEFALKHIQHNRSQEEIRLKQSIRERVYEAHSVATHLYRQFNSSMDEGELKFLIKEALRPVRFNSGRGYIFAVTMDGIEELYPTRPEMEGENLIDLKDVKGNYVIRDEIEVVGKYGEGFVTGYWPKPEEDPAKSFLKISFVKLFKPLNWYLGAGEYLDDVEEDIKGEILKWVGKMKTEMGTGLFIFSPDGKIVFHHQDELIGCDLSDPAVSGGRLFVSQIWEAAAKEGGGFVEYLAGRADANGPQERKISFVKSIPGWDWVLAGEASLIGIEEYLHLQQRELRNEVWRHALIMIVTLVVLFIFIIITAKYLADKIEKGMDTFTQWFKRAEEEAVTIDSSKINFAELKRLVPPANRMIEKHKKAEEKLKTLLEEKELLLKEVHHRIKNNLQILSSLLNLQSAYLKPEKLAECEILQESRTRVNAMSLIHEKLYRSKNFSTIRFNEYTKTLVDNIFISFDVDPSRITLNYNMQEIDLNVDTAIPCSLLLNELITNCIKHAFPDNREGVITIELHKLEGEKTMIILEDNGVGLPPGLNIQEADSLGLKLVETLVKQIEGKLELRSGESGTRWKIIF